MLPAAEWKEPAAFDVVALELSRDVGRHADEQRQRIVESRGVSNERARELPARFEAVPAVARIELEYADRRIEPRDIEATIAAPSADADRQTRHGIQFHSASHGGIPHVRPAALLDAATQPLVGAELRRVQRRHHIGAIRDRRAEAPVDAGADVEPRGGNDHGVDEWPLDAVEHRRLVPLVDDAHGHEQHAGAKIERRLEEHVDIRLFELHFAGFLESFDKRVLDLELADESKAVGETVGEQENEAVEIERRVAVGAVERRVQVHLHVAGDGSRARLVALIPLRLLRPGVIRQADQQRGCERRESFCGLQDSFLSYQKRILD